MTVDDVIQIKQTGCHGAENLEPGCKTSVTENNGIGRTLEMPVDNKNSVVRKDMNINHSSKGHIDNDSRVHIVSMLLLVTLPLVKCRKIIKSLSLELFRALVVDA